MCIIYLWVEDNVAVCVCNSSISSDSGINFVMIS